jgi:hypothetical protein
MVVMMMIFGYVFSNEFIYESGTLRRADVLRFFKICVSNFSFTIM